MHTYNGNNFLGFISGILGGVGSYLLNIKIGVLDDMMIAILTALLCGAAGVAGKEAYQAFKKKIKKRK